MAHTLNNDEKMSYIECQTYRTQKRDKNTTYMNVLNIVHFNDCKVRLKYAYSRTRGM